MKEHQKYFHLQNSNGDLLPRFLTVANIESSEPDRIVHGNERVIRPRLADAAFFYDNDLKTPLADRQAVLEKMTFQHKLGSVYDKVIRVTSLSSLIATQIGADAEIASRGAALAKSDLASELVNEFPELQGIAGAYYARAEGLGDDIADVIEQHYLPRYATDILPTSLEATAVAIADRCDTLAGIFAIGEIPSGSKDPFALRRASLAVLRLIIQNNLTLNLEQLFSEALTKLPIETPADSLGNLISYINERYYARYETQGIPVTTIRAVINQGINEPLDFENRLNALVKFSKMPEAIVLASAYKRVSNILAKAESYQSSYSSELLIEISERALATAIEAITPRLEKAISTNDYSSYLTELASLREPVDTFFDHVMVNADDEKLRQNRLGLLSTLASLFGSVADLKELAIS
jgi:glycyl-tRNA synthetase beta chain